jgi:hypothetical protein
MHARVGDIFIIIANSIIHSSLTLTFSVHARRIIGVVMNHGQPYLCTSHSYPDAVRTDLGLSDSLYSFPFSSTKDIPLVRARVD